MARTCGECVACCVYFPIRDLGKGAYTPCRHLREKRPVAKSLNDMPLLTSGNYQLDTVENCGVHSECPEACSGYICAWLGGVGAENDRPDKSGVLLDNVAGARVLRDGLVAKPLWLGAEGQPPGTAAIERASRSTNKPVLVLEFTEQRLLRIVGRGVE